MKKMVWTDAFSVGVPLMDEQHKRLIEMINALADASEAVCVFDIIMRMYSYADEHFLAEEALMRRHDYGGRDEHIAAHRNFRSKATDLADRDYTQGVARREVFSYLREWLSEHILKVDMAYKGCFSQEQST